MIKLQASMVGMWFNPFGISNKLAVGNMMAGIGFRMVPCPVGMCPAPTSFNFGGEVMSNTKHIA